MALMLLALHPSETDDELLARMRAARTARESGAATNVVATVGCFATDPRDLWDIPEARALCQRLVATGLVGVLDAIASRNPRTAGTLGAAEAIWVARGLSLATVGHRCRTDRDFEGRLRAETNETIRLARETALAALGPSSPTTPDGAP